MWTEVRDTNDFVIPGKEKPYWPAARGLECSKKTHRCAILGVSHALAR